MCCCPSQCLLLVSTLALVSAYSARPQYYNQMAASSNSQYHSGSAPTTSQTNYKVSSSSHGSEKESQILHSSNDIKEDGSYHYEFETSNGIKRSEQGAPDGSMQGSTSYISPEGIEIKTTYVADETGYHPVGDHIPKIPDYILRSLEYIRTHPYVEKDYYTGEVKQANLNNKVIPAVRRNQHNNNGFNSNNRYNF